ncbi:MAG: DUF4176 domain-containing protein [Clostridia bacterium]|nr:DUF4176 domain-containing protein [Clostridia bacterium]
MSAIEFLPLGSVVSLKDIPDKMIIIGRGINVQLDGETWFCDYSGVIYPEGLVGAEAVYFNHSNIENVIFTGYDDDTNKIICDGLNRYLEAHPETKRYKPRRPDIWN